MEPAKGYALKLGSLNEALDKLDKSLQVKLNQFDDVVVDTIKSGQVQKFEICVELFWKTIRKFLYEIHGVETVSPKMSIKEFYRTRYIDEKHYEIFIEMINDRNRLSHLYDEVLFNEIYKRLPLYLQQIQSATIKMR